MNFENFHTHGDSHERAFETFTCQLFDSWVRRTKERAFIRFVAVNGAGGDGGVEAYAEVTSNESVGLQAKWFPRSIKSSEIRKIKSSIETAIRVRKNLFHYIVCVPRNFQSEKVGNANKKLANPEEKRIQDLITNLRKQFPQLKVEFWDAHRLLQEVQHPNNEGVLRYWFEREQASLSTLIQKFSLAKSGWLRERYAPSSLHTNGRIREVLDCLSYSIDYRRSAAKRIFSIWLDLQAASSSIGQFTELIKRKKTSIALVKKLNQLKCQLDTNAAQVRNLEVELRQGLPLTPLDDAGMNLSDTIEQLGQQSLTVFENNVFLRVVRCLEKLVSSDFYKLLQGVIYETNPFNLIILGAAGTGKTQGCAQYIETCVNKGLPGIIVNAKDVDSKSWVTIFKDSLSTFIDWNETQIFNALESLCLRTDLIRIGNHDDDLEPELTRFLVCVDGIDEVFSQQWKNRIGETEELIKRFPRIRFVFTTRSFPGIDNPYKFEYTDINRKFQLPASGDTPLIPLAEQYLTYYKINYENNPSLPERFDNALEVRLFCEEYSGHQISLKTNVSTDIDSLVRIKLKRIESEFFLKHKPKWSKSEEIFLRSLDCCGDLFVQHATQERRALSQALVEYNAGIFDLAWAGLILDAFSENGILSSFQQRTKPGTISTQTIYQITYQTYLDYVISRRAYDETIVRHTKKVPDVLKLASYNSIKLAGTLLLLRDDILVGENGYWSDAVVQMPYLQMDILRHVPLGKADNFLPILLKLFRRSTAGRNEVLENFILKTIHRTDFKGAKYFVHEQLLSFKSVFERDKFWSGPGKYDLEKLPTIALILRNIEIPANHTHEQLPLIFAWSFSSLDRSATEHNMEELMRWARRNVNEFIALLNLVFQCSDELIRERLSSILLGIATVTDKPGFGIKLLSHWVLQNIFNDGMGLNSVVRMCGRSIVERAYALGELDAKHAQKARPPYNRRKSLLRLDFSTKPDIRDAREPIVQDLAWYVIKKSYRNFLDIRFGDKAYPEAELMLDRYRKKYRRPKMRPIEFAMGFAIAYLKGLGWKGKGHGMTEKSGGSISDLLTLEEKYTWLAVHDLQGYLADTVPFGSYGDKREAAPFYELFVDTFNPGAANSYTDDAIGDELAERYYLPEDLWTPLPSSIATLDKRVFKWVNQKTTPNFKLWTDKQKINLPPTSALDTTWTTLYSYTHFHEPTEICRSSLEVICCAVPEKFLNTLIKRVKRSHPQDRADQFGSFRNALFNVERYGYSPPEEFLWKDWIPQADSTLDLYDDFCITKTCGKVTAVGRNGGEEFPKLPSRDLLKAAKVTSLDGPHFYAERYKTKMVYYRVGRGDEQEMLLMDHHDFYKYLSENRLRPFWLVKQFRTTGLKERLGDNDYHTQKVRAWLVWSDRNSIRNYKYLDSYASNLVDVDEKD